MFAVQMPLVTPEEYLHHEKEAETKSEYISGEILAMAGGTPEHSAIATEVRRILGNLLLERGCEVFDSDLKVRIEDAGPFFYPDASVVCGEPAFDANFCLRNPVLIVEVLSEGTAVYDRGEKFRNYRRLDSLRHYLLIDQNQCHVEHYRQVEGFFWELVGEYNQRQDTITLNEMEITLTLNEIYRRVGF
jgi:Uma2 family endonuclease